MFDARWSVVSWPEEYGGRGAGLFEWLIFEEEYYRAGAPTRVGQNGIFLLAPTLFEFGTPEQKARYLPAMASGEEIWCQGWSEPDAGSDLAAIRSRARPPPHRPARPAPAAPGCSTARRRGAHGAPSPTGSSGCSGPTPRPSATGGSPTSSCPWTAPGVTVRPIAQLDGETGFAEVFFEDVEVPDAPGARCRGRGLEGGHGHGRLRARPVAAEPGPLHRGRGSDWSSSIADAPERDPAACRPRADAVARAVIDAEAYRLHTYWTATRVLDGGGVGPEASMNKLFWSETDLAIHSTALELLGDEAELLGDDGRPPAVARRIPLRPGRTHLRRHQRDPAQRGGRARARAAPVLSDRALRLRRAPARVPRPAAGLRRQAVHARPTSARRGRRPSGGPAPLGGAGRDGGGGAHRSRGARRDWAWGWSISCCCWRRPGGPGCPSRWSRRSRSACPCSSSAPGKQGEALRAALVGAGGRRRGRDGGGDVVDARRARGRGRRPAAARARR